MQTEAVCPVTHRKLFLIALITLTARLHLAVLPINF